MVLRPKFLQKRHRLTAYRQKLSMRLVRARSRLREKGHLIPHLCTLGNAFFGFCSLICAAADDTTAAAYFILFGALLDGMDGRLARYMGSCSQFGVELDSLADALSFCIAPAFLMYQNLLYKIGPFGFLSVSLFFLCGLIRLARFNVTHEQQSHFFLGVPTTIAGCFLASSTLNASANLYLLSNPLVGGLLVTALALLMVSTFPFPTGKHSSRRTSGIVFVCTTATIVILGLTRVLFFLFLFYFFYAFVKYMHKKKCSQSPRMLII